MPMKQHDPLMRRALQAWVFLLFSALFTFAQAASLGRLTVLSSLGQPLRAEVEILDVADDEAEKLAVALAPVEAYRRSGLDYPALLKALDIKVVQEGERRFARIHSAQPVSEPYIGLLLELAAGQARKGREYALTLDTAERTSLRSAPLSSAASMERLSRQQRVERLFTRTIPTDAARPTAVLGGGESQEGREAPAASRYVVARGDTLSKIAARLNRRDISLEQMLVALYRNNPEAFLDNNMNLLKEGASLSIPDTVDGTDVSRSEARSVVKLHAANFNDYSQKLAGMARRSAPRSAPATGQVAEGRISAQVKEQPTPASRLPDRLELSKARPDERQSGMTVEEKVAITQAVEENRHRIVELEKNVGELKNLLEIVSENGAAITRQAQEPEDKKADGKEKAQPAQDKAEKGRKVPPEAEGKKDATDSDAVTEEKEGAEPSQTPEATPEKAALSEGAKKTDNEDEDDASSDEDDDEEDEHDDGEASGEKRAASQGLSGRLVWLAAAGAGVLLLVLIALFFLMRRKKAAAPARAAVTERPPREEQAEEVNPNIISGREYLENLPPDMDEDEDEADSGAADSADDADEEITETAEADAGEFEAVEFPQVEGAFQDAPEEEPEIEQETEQETADVEQELADVPVLEEKAGEDEPFVSLDQASVEKEEETVQDATPPDGMALPEVLAEEAALTEAEDEAAEAEVDAEAFAEAGNVAEKEADDAPLPDASAAVEEAALKEADNAEKARALELDLSDIDFSAGAEDDVSGQPDGALPGDADAIEAEMAAKLELAMAYLDMKDKDGARELLEEVMAKGTPRQAEEAAQAMQSL